MHHLTSPVRVPDTAIPANSPPSSTYVLMSLYIHPMLTVPTVPKLALKVPEKAFEIKRAIGYDYESDLLMGKVFKWLQ